MPRRRTAQELHELHRDAEEGARRLTLESLKMLFLINGGAIVAILTLIGVVVRERPRVNVLGLGEAVGMFGAAVVLVAVTTAYAAFGNTMKVMARAEDSTFFTGRDNYSSTIWPILGGAVYLLLVGLSVACTARGFWVAADGFYDVLTLPPAATRP